MSKITNVLICGIFSQTGMMIYNLARKRTDMYVVCGVDEINSLNANCDVPVYKSFDEVKEVVDVVVDFSHPDMLEKVLAFVRENNCKLIEGTAGLTRKQKDNLHVFGKTSPVFVSNYLSIGMNLLLKLSFAAAKALGSYDIEIIEKYYSAKINTPGETTLNLAEHINEALGGKRKIVIGRSSKRKGDEICIHCVRGGNITGDHEIMFVGEREVLTIKHETLDMAVYSEGAIEIINFMIDKPAGYYTLHDYYGS